jgi:tRNA nucleotidyltransferase (CCA-adding enzyme)
VPALILRAIRRKARRLGTPVYLVGGPLRDVLLGRPIADIDLAVEGDAARFGKALARELRGTFKSYRQFGTGTVAMKDSRIQGLEDYVGHVDVARTRTETYASSAALPRVRRAGIVVDLRRRDFTINAMAWRLAQPHAGGLVDPFGGITDLRCGLIRVLHDKSFEDDPTRVFRAVRFACRFKFRIEPATRALMKRAIREGRLKLLSGKRVMTELSLVVREANPGAILAALDRLGAFSSAFGQRLGAGCYANLARIPEPELRLLHLLSCVRRVAGMPLTREQSADLASLKAFPGLRMRLERAMRPSQVCQILKGQTRNALRIRAALLSGARAGARAKILAYLDKYSHVKPRLAGQDLLALGIEPGPIYSELLNKLLAARLDGKVKTREDEEKLVKRLSGSKGVREQGSKTRGDCRLQSANCRVQNGTAQPAPSARSAAQSQGRDR